jgi:hypothetical protein
MKSEFRPEIEEAANNINQPRIHEIMKELSRYGLGVSVPHAHDENGNFIRLEKGMVSLEENLNVSFHSSKDVSNENYLTVGWRWDSESGAPVPTNKCEKYGKCD